MIKKRTEKIKEEPMVKKAKKSMSDIVNLAIKRKASDLFFIPGEPPSIRVKGKIERMEYDILSPKDTMEMAEDILGRDRMKQIGTDLGEIHKSKQLYTKDYNLVFNVSRSKGNYTIAIQLIEAVIASPEDTRLPESVLKEAEKGSGIIIISGIVGSGKTTSAYSLVEHINRTSSCHICTVEDPIYLGFTPKKAIIQQREVGTDVPDVLSGIRAAMRQDLDVLFIGDISSIEELQACITMAETGHLVVTIMHATSPEDAIRRIVHIYPEDIRAAACKTLARTLAVVTAQRLFPRADKKGRVAAYDVLIPDATIRRKIEKGQDIGDYSRIPGCQTMHQAIRKLIQKGSISKDVVS
jgi:twitching motility protein PilT